MKLEALKSVEVKGIKVPKRVEVPDFADANKLSDRIFGAFCKINPELACMEDEVFIKNVFTCIKAAGGEDYLAKSRYCKLPAFVKEDPKINKWREWYAKAKVEKAAYSAAHKDEIKAAKEEFAKLYGNVVLNGVEEPLQSCTVEPEGIYPGRGDSPLRGYWKFEHVPEDIKVNTNSENLPVLIRVGEDDGDEEVVETTDKWNISWNPNAHFAAQYNNLVGIPNPDGSVKTLKATKYKMIQFAATSSVKKEGQSKKYAAASDLGKAYDKIITAVKKDFEKARNDDKVADLSTAIAVFMLFEKGIRIGFSEATVNGTKGLLALEWNKDVKRIDNKIKFNFYGKDSVKDNSFIETEYADIIEKGWSKYTKLRTDKAAIKYYIGKLAPAVKDVFSPKLCRTAVAASVMTKALEEVAAKYKITEASPEALKKLAFNEANMAVAKRLNHQRGVNKAAEEKRDAANKEREQKLKERAAKNKETEAKRLERIKALKKAKKDGWQEKVAKLQQQIAKADERLEQGKRDLKFREENGNITGATSKAAYIDPGIVSEWCAKVDLSLEKIYTKAQIKQFEQFFEKEE